MIMKVFLKRQFIITCAGPILFYHVNHSAILIEGDERPAKNRAADEAFLLVSVGRSPSAVVLSTLRQARGGREGPHCPQCVLCAVLPELTA